MNYTNEQFREEMIHYLDENWKEDITLEKVAVQYGYSENYFNLKFKECFGLPFLRYVTKMKLHRAAMIISQNGTLMNIGKLSGYASAQSFSKAFRKEFGVSPKHFLQSEEEIPDMPVYRFIHGQPVQAIYAIEPKSILHGQMVIPIHGNDTDRAKEVGYYFDYMCDKVDYNLEDNRNNGEELMEMWWHDDQCNMRYIIGMPVAEDTDAPEGKIKITIPQDYYAVLSVKYEHGVKESKEGISAIAKELTQFAFHEWRVMNGKNLRQMGYTFIKYKEDEVSIYLPVYKRNIVLGESKPKFKGAADWIQYIDENLKSNLTVKMLAEAFNYSERHFTDTFEMYYGIRPGLYMKKRRLYLAAKELRDGETDLEKLVESYGFHSIEGFRKSFLEEFSCMPDYYEGEEYEVENLHQYYTYHKNKLQVRYEVIPDITMTGRNVSATLNSNGTEGDLIDAIAWFLQCDSFMGWNGKAEEESRIVVWQSANELSEHYCLVGPELTKKKDVFVEKEEDIVTIRGGYYVVMETLNDKDINSLAETYRLLYRCAFGEWIRENQERVDLMRLTFVRFEDEKLQFYIPINA